MEPDAETIEFDRRLHARMVKFIRASKENRALLIDDEGGIWTSPDEMHWTKRHPDRGVFRQKFYTDADLRDGLFVVVGKAGAIATSYDGGQVFVTRISPVNGDLALLPAERESKAWKAKTDSETIISDDGFIWRRA